MLLAGVGYGLFYVVDAIEEKSEVVRVHKAQELRDKNLEFGNQLRSNLKTLSEQEAIIQSTFISETNMVGFIQTLESSARLYGLEITIANVDQGDVQALSSGTGKTIPVTFTLQTKGSYAQTQLFIDELLRLEKRLVLSQLSIYKGEEGEYTARMIVEGIILSYE
jgi:hypothetical protein